MEPEEASWNYKKIVVTLLIVSILGWIGYQNREYIAKLNANPAGDVAGVQTVKLQNDQTKVAVPHIDVQQKISDITEQISQLDVNEVAASSPQVQKVLKDMESLKNLPHNEAKNACMNICNSL